MKTVYRQSRGMPPIPNSCRLRGHSQLPAGVVMPPPGSAIRCLHTKAACLLNSHARLLSQETTHPPDDILDLLHVCWEPLIVLFVLSDHVVVCSAVNCFRCTGLMNRGWDATCYNALHDTCTNAVVE